MNLASVCEILGALNRANTRYLIAGGMAVNAHGYLRLTQVLDIVIQMSGENIQKAFAALLSIGYRPLVPATVAQFSNESIRLQWIKEKGMQVLNFYNDARPETTIDLFVTEPFEFEQEWNAALQGELAPGLNTRFVSIPTLIMMKQRAGRPKDLDDIQHLQWILDEGGRDGSGT
jgi:hypothetical protein